MTQTILRCAIGSAIAASCFTLAVAGRSLANNDKKPPPKELKLLWIGSSSTGLLMPWVEDVLNAPGSDVKIAQKKGGGYYRVDYSSKWIDSGDRQRVAKQLMQIKKAIAADKYDFVIFQVSGGIFTSPAEEKHVVEIIDTMCGAIIKAGATPVLFEHWSKHPEKMRHYCVQAARKHKARVIFSGSAVAEVRADKGFAYFGKAFTGHINAPGNYLWTCCAYATLTGRSPVGLPAPRTVKKKKVNFTKEEIAYLQAQAWTAHQKFSKLLTGPK